MQPDMPLFVHRSFIFPATLGGSKTVAAEPARPSTPSLFRGIVIGLAIEGAAVFAILLTIKLIHSL